MWPSASPERRAPPFSQLWTACVLKTTYTHRHSSSAAVPRAPRQGLFLLVPLGLSAPGAGSVPLGPRVTAEETAQGGMKPDMLPAQHPCPGLPQPPPRTPALHPGPRGGVALRGAATAWGVISEDSPPVSLPPFLGLGRRFMEVPKRLECRRLPPLGQLSVCLSAQPRAAGPAAACASFQSGHRPAVLLSPSAVALVVLCVGAAEALCARGGARGCGAPSSFLGPRPALLSGLCPAHVSACLRVCVSACLSVCVSAAGLVIASCAVVNRRPKMSHSRATRSSGHRQVHRVSQMPGESDARGVRS